MPYKAVRFDKEVVLGLARDGASNDEIAAFYDCKGESVTFRCHKILKRGRHLMAMDLRKSQLDLAKTGNSAMLTFLGKELLNQSGKPSETETDEPNPTDDLSTKDLHKLLKKGSK